MRKITFAALAALALSMTGARAESNNLSAVETPFAARSVQSFSVAVDTGSECSPVSGKLARVTESGPALRDESSESTPVFALLPASSDPVRVVAGN